MFIDNLWSLLNSGMFDTSAPVNNALVGSIGSMLQGQYTDGQQLINNLLPGTSDINGVVQWEQMLGLVSDTSLTLQQRQQRCLAKAYRLTGAITKTQLTDVLNAFSTSKGASIIESPSTYQVYGQLPVDDMTDYQAILNAVRRVIPAHLQYIPTFLLNPKSEIQSAGSQFISVKVDPIANIDGTQLAMNPSWKLDGTFLLSSSFAPGFTSRSSELIVVSRNSQYAQIQTSQGILIDGMRVLDGTWTMAGLITNTFNPAPTSILSISVNRKQANNISAAIIKQLTSTRVAAISNVHGLDGSWVLDASRNLVEGPIAVAVTVNGQTV